MKRLRMGEESKGKERWRDRQERDERGQKETQITKEEGRIERRGTGEQEQECGIIYCVIICLLVV